MLHVRFREQEAAEQDAIRWPTPCRSLRACATPSIRSGIPRASSQALRTRLARFGRFVGGSRRGSAWMAGGGPPHAASSSGGDHLSHHPPSVRPDRPRGTSGATRRTRGSGPWDWSQPCLAGRRRGTRGYADSSERFRDPTVRARSLFAMSAAIGLINRIQPKSSPSAT